MDSKANSTTEIFFVSLLGLKQFWGSILQIQLVKRFHVIVISSFIIPTWRLPSSTRIEERETPIGQDSENLPDNQPGDKSKCQRGASTSDLGPSLG